MRLGLPKQRSLRIDNTFAQICPTDPANMGSKSPRVLLGDKNETQQLNLKMKELVELIKKCNADDTQQVHFLLAFDEAHLLYEGSGWSRYTHLRKALRATRQIEVFAVFLSTVGKVELLAPPARMDSSERINKNEIDVHRPFCGLGFDQFARVIRNKKISLDDVTKLEFLVMMGRPL